MKYDRIKEIIDRWDPIDLLTHAPHDEYDFEIQEITELIVSSMNEYEVGGIVYKVFLDSFGKDTFQKDINECNAIARKILSK